MNQHTKAEDFGTLIEPTTLKIERMLPGPIERVWDYIAKEELRRQWLASGDIKHQLDSPFELVWRGADWYGEAGERPQSVPAEPRMKCQVVAYDPPHKLAFKWGEKSEVSFSLKSIGERVLFTLLHERIPDRSTAVGVSTGWHSHLDLLEALLGQTKPQPFWDHWVGLKQEYNNRIPN